MGEALRTKMPRQKTKKSFAGSRPDYAKNYDSLNQWPYF